MAEDGISTHCVVQSSMLSTQMDTSPEKVTAECVGAVPDVAVNHIDEARWHGVAFRTAISMELIMSAGLGSSQPFRLWSTHFRTASNFLQCTS